MRTYRVFFASLFVMIASFSKSYAGSVYLTNDSPYKLRAVVRANDGTFLGEVIVTPQSTNMWTDGFAGLPGGLQIQRSQTPYTVLWYCLEGDPFSTAYPVTPGSTATAMGGQGARQCRPQKQKQPEGEVQPPPQIPIPPQNAPNPYQEPDSMTNSGFQN